MLTGNQLGTPVNVRNLLQRGLTEKPEDIALISVAVRWSWRDLNQAASNLARNLLDMGLSPGERIASLMPNRAHLIIHYIACFKAGLVMVPLNYRYTATEIDHALEVSGASALVAHAERTDDIEASRLAADLPHGIIDYEGGAGDNPRLEVMLESDSTADIELPEVPADSPAIIFFTSGSTGRPKGVTHTAQTLGWMLRSCAGAFEMNAQDVVLPGSSISHLGGFMFSFSALGVGARTVVDRTLEVEEALTLLREDRPTVFCMLPTALLHLIRDCGATREDFKSLRVCRSGSDKVPAELEKQFHELTGMDIDEGYGMTEVGLATLNPPSGVIKFGSVGLPTPGFEMSIRDEQGNEVLAGGEGRLWMKTPTATVGYWNNPEATGELIQDGWLDSGDVMKSDADGYLYFRGRKKQIIVHDGSNISPQEIEEVLLEHPAVDNAGVIGVHDLLHGENVRAYVALRTGATPPTATELIQFARKRVGYKAPEEIVFLDEIPLNPTGKVDRVGLKKRAAEPHTID